MFIDRIDGTIFCFNFGSGVFIPEVWGGGGDWVVSDGRVRTCLVSGLSEPFLKLPLPVQEGLVDACVNPKTLHLRHWMDSPICKVNLF